MCVATRAVRPICGSDPLRRRTAMARRLPDVKAQAARARRLGDRRRRTRCSDAIKRKAFARGFKREVRLPADLVVRTEQLLEQVRPRRARPWPAKPAWWQPGSPKPRAALAQRRRCRPLACGRGCARRRPQARRGAAAVGPARPDRLRRIPYFGAIGFGIEPPKCDTCSPARWPREAKPFWRVAGALNGFGAGDQNN